MDKERFARAIEAAAARQRGAIGTLGEKGVHNTLKHYYEPDPDCHEVTVGGYVADIVGENGIIEIQSGSFSRLREKLERFLECSRVMVVWPCVVNKRLINIDSESGDVISMRRSNLHKGEYDIFWELYNLRDLLKNPNLTICIAQLEADEYRPSDRKRGRRHKGANNGVERYPTALSGEIRLSCPEDYLRFLPAGLPEQYTVKQFAALAGLYPDPARSCLTVLTALGITEKCGKQGNAFVYRTAPQYSSESPPESTDRTAENASCSDRRALPDPHFCSQLLSQPLDGLEGQMCIAMLTGMPIADVIARVRVGRWKLTPSAMLELLDAFGIRHSEKMRQVRKKGVALPDVCIISEHGHLLLHCRGVFYDSIRGVFENYDQQQMTGYIEIHL